MSPVKFPRGGCCALVLLAAMVVPAAGCSVALMKPPPADHQRRDDFYCSLDIGWPIIDGLASVVLLSAANSIGNGDTVDSSPAPQRGASPAQEDRALRVAAAGATAAAAVSALYGFYQAGQCRRAVHLWRLRTAAKAQPPPALPPDGWSSPPDVWMLPPPGAAPRPPASDPTRP